MNEKDKLAWERACDALYGFGYSEQFSIALWQAALEYARQPAQAEPVAKAVMGKREVSCHGPNRKYVEGVVIQQLKEIEPETLLYTHTAQPVQPSVAQGEPVAINPIQKRRVFDYIRGAYDLGYNDARDAKAVPGDSAPGYQGRSVEKDHGEALIHAINCTNNAPPAAINEQILAHLKSAHSFIEETEAFGFQARDGILQCGNSIWNIDKSKAAIRAAEVEKAKGGV